MPKFATVALGTRAQKDRPARRGRVFRGRRGTRAQRDRPGRKASVESRGRLSQALKANRALLARQAPPERLVQEGSAAMWVRREKLALRAIRVRRASKESLARMGRPAKEASQGEASKAIQANADQRDRLAETASMAAMV